VGLSTTTPDGGTPIDPDEARALLPKHVATQAQLNEWEHRNIVEGERWAFGYRRKNILTRQFTRRLHRKMFGATWRWAGNWRTTEKNFGIAPELIPARIAEVLADVAAQLERGAYPIPEIAARLHHRVVEIHPFPNGNGRFARLLADLLLVNHGHRRFTWGGEDLEAPGAARESYIAALRAADAHDYGPLFAFLGIQLPK